MKLGFEESPVALLQRLAKCPRLDGSVGARMGVLPALRQCEDFVVSKQQSACGFLLRVLQRGVRAQEPEGQIRRESPRRGIQHEMPTSRRQQQSKSAADELRPQVTCGRQSVHRAEAFFRSRYHRRAAAAGADGAARRLGWLKNPARASTGVGKIHIVQNGIVRAKELVLAEWQKTLFLRDESLKSRGWLLDVMKCVESLGKREFTLDEVYAFERHLGELYPGNQNVRPKIRQQLQYLRNRGFLDFVSRGSYRLRS